MADISKITVNSTQYNIKDATARNRVTSVDTGIGLVGGEITSTGTVKANLKYETAHTLSSNAQTNIANKQYAVSVDSDGYLSVNVPWSDSDTIPTCQCNTSASTAAKVGSCTYWVLTPNSYIHVNFRYANSYNGAITLNINKTGARNVYINGVASSSSNKTLPAGSYIAFYDGGKYQFRTDGKLPASITGDSGTVGGHTVAIDVPADAKFTDTTYVFDGTYDASTNKGATVSTVTTAIGALDGTVSGSPSASKTLTAFSQTDGKVSATFGNISITKSQISDFPTFSTLRPIPFSISANNWVLSNGKYSYTYPTAYVTSSSVDFIEYDESFRTALRGDIKAVKTQGGGGVTFTTDVLPVATLSGEIRAFDSDDGRYSVVLQDTVIPIANGGTGASSLVGAQTNLGISGLMTDVSGLTTNVSELNNRFAYEDRSERITIYSSRIKTITHLSYKKYSNGFVEIYITGVANSMASDSVTIFAVSGNNPRLGGYFIFGTASMVNAQLANESSGDYINKSACAVSANTPFVVHLTGYELT